MPDNVKPTSAVVDWTQVDGKFTTTDALMYKDWARLIPQGATLVELGTYKGRSAACFLQTLGDNKRSNLRLVCIDVWASEVNGVTIAHAYQNLKPYVDRIAALTVPMGTDILRLVQWDSISAAKLYARESVWGVFLDTVHTYPIVKENIKAWWDKIPPGGVMGFHDYYKPSWPGVVQAIDEIFQLHTATFRSGACIGFTKQKSWDGNFPIV